MRLRFLRWSAFFLVAFAAANAGAQDSRPLITPTDLAARLDDPLLRVVDIRPASGKGSTYAAGHIRGALSAPYAQWRGPKDSPGSVPDPAALTQLIRPLGIDARTTVVVVGEGADSTDFGAAARVYWTLKTAGLTRLTILNGGMNAWRAAGLPVTTEVKPVAPSDFEAIRDSRLIATRSDVERALGAGRTALIDARPPAYFDGETRHPAAASPGTIVGARNVDSDVWFSPDGRTLLPTSTASQVARAYHVDLSQPTVSFCNTGHWAATNWFVLSEVLGHPDVRLYPESLVEWSRAGLPMEHVPGRFAQFWLQLKEATGNL